MSTWYNSCEGDTMQKKEYQLILEFTKDECEFILEVAKATNLSISELFVLSVLALRLPLGTADLTQTTI